MAKKKTSDVEKTVKKGYNKAKSTAKKHGKLKQFYLVIAIVLIIAIVAVAAYYFAVVKPLEDSKCIITANVNGITTEYKYYPSKEMPQISSPEKKGYKFNGWFLDTELTDDFNVDEFVANPEKNITIYPSFVPNTYTITAKADNVEVESLQYIYDGQFPTFKTPVKEGSSFIGWYLDKDFTIKFTEQAFKDNPKNLSIYAKFNIEYFKFDDYETIDTSKEPNLIERNSLDIYFLDVDQADCALILLPDGRNMLIDAGDDIRASEKHIEDMLNSFDIKTIDYMMLTHTDSDHVGGMDYILENFEVKNIFMPKLLPNRKAGTPENRYDFITPDMKKGVISSKVYYDFFTLADDEVYLEDGIEKNTKLFINAGFMEIIGKDYSLEIYCMDEEVYDKVFDDAKEKNEVSPSVILDYKDKKTLFTGDGCGSSHDDFINKYSQRHDINQMDFDVYKAAHHGSSTHGSNKLDFLMKIKTEYSILSCKESPKYNDIPSKMVMYNLQKTGNKVYRTDICGDIRLYITAKGVIKLTADSETDNDTTFTEKELIAEPPVKMPAAA